MKKFLLLTLALSAAFFAKGFDKEALAKIDFDKYIVLKVAERADLQGAALTLGTMTGNPLVGGYLANQAASFEPASAGIEVDPSLKNGEIACVTIAPELIDKIFEMKEELKPYKGAVKSAQAKYIVTKAGIDLKATVDFNDDLKAKFAAETTFKSEVFSTLPSETLAFAFGENPEVKLLTVDVKKELDKLKALEEKKEEIDWEKKGEKLGKILEKDYAGKSFALAFKGFTPAKKASERFEATFPEYKETELKLAGFFSAYSLVKTLLPVYISVLDDPDEKTMMTMFMMQLPEEGVGGLAMVLTQSEDGKAVAHYRISADEVKAISGAANAVFMMAMMNGGMNGGLFEEDGGSDGMIDDSDLLIDDEDLDLED